MSLIPHSTVPQFVGHGDAVLTLAVADDGLTLLSGSLDGTVRLWDLSTGMSGKTFDQHLLPVTCGAFLSDGKLAASGGWDKRLRIWQRTNAAQSLSLSEHTLAINTLAVAPKADLAFTGSDDHTVCVWNLGTGNLNTILIGHTSPVTCACIMSFAENGSRSYRLVTADKSGTIRIWDPDTWSLAFDFPAHQSEIVGISALWTGELVTAAADGAVRIWRPGWTDPNAANAWKHWQRNDLGSHSDPVVSLAAWPNGLTSPVGDPAPFVVSGDTNGVIRFWDLAGSSAATVRGHQGPVLALAVLPNGQGVVSGGSDAIVKQWQIRKLKCEQHNFGTSTIPGFACSRAALTVLVRGWSWSLREFVLTTNANNTNKVYALKDADLKFGGQPDFNQGTTLSPDGDALLSYNVHVGRDNQGIDRIYTNLWLYDITSLVSGDIDVQFNLEFEGDSLGAHLMPDKKRAIIARAEGNSEIALSLWDLPTSRELSTFTDRAPALSAIDGDNCIIQLSTDGTMVLAANSHIDITIWDLATGLIKSSFPNSSMYRFPSHVGSRLDGYAVFSPDSQYVASASTAASEAIRLFSLQTGQEILRFESPHSPISCLAFSPDGTRLISSSSDVLELWDVANGKKIMQFRGHEGIIYCLCFLLPGEWVVSGSRDQTIRFWELP